MTYAVRPGAEAVSHSGSEVGVLVLHGFTGSPQTMRPITEALVAEGLTVEAPRLPGHGTDVEEMLQTGFDDWSTHVEAAYADLAARVERIAIVGLSMGGTLAAWLASRHPEILGVVFVNPLVAPIDPAMLAIVDEMVAAGETIAPGIGSDIADPDAVEEAYAGTPLAPLLSLAAGVAALELSNISCPVLIMTSTNDHVVDPSNTDHLAASVSGPVERVVLERSYHVATLDFDRDLIVERTLEFVRKVTA